MLNKIFLLLLLCLLYSCEKKEGVYFENNIEWVDSTVYLQDYVIYSSSEVVYEEHLGITIEIKNLNTFKDSLQEAHKEKFDIFYIECQ